MAAGERLRRASESPTPAAAGDFTLDGPRRVNPAGMDGQEPPNPGSDEVAWAGPAPHHRDLAPVPDEPPAAALQDSWWPPDSARPVRHPPSGPRALDVAPLRADSRTYPAGSRGTRYDL